MKKFMFCKLCVIVFGALLAVDISFAEVTYYCVMDKSISVEDGQVRIAANDSIVLKVDDEKAVIGAKQVEGLTMGPYEFQYIQYFDETFFSAINTKNGHLLGMYEGRYTHSYIIPSLYGVLNTGHCSKF